MQAQRNLTFSYFSKAVFLGKINKFSDCCTLKLKLKTCFALLVCPMPTVTGS